MPDSFRLSDANCSVKKYAKTVVVRADRRQMPSISKG